ncbi:Gypsy retrotransposon integrase-like protein 1, partial [Coelomomyces lativittatus]
DSPSVPRSTWTINRLTRVWPELRHQFYWEKMNKDLFTFLKHCHECQMCDNRGREEAYLSRPLLGVMQELSMDHMYMGPCKGYTHLLDLRCNFSGWSEVQPVASEGSEHVIEFLQ